MKLLNKNDNPSTYSRTTFNLGQTRKQVENDDEGKDDPAKQNRLLFSGEIPVTAPLFKRPNSKSGIRSSSPTLGSKNNLPPNLPPRDSPAKNAVQKPSGVWRIPHGTSGTIKEVPALRSSAIKLEKEYESVLRVLSTSKGGGRTTNPDLLSIQATVDAHLAKREMLCKAAEGGKIGRGGKGGWSETTASAIS